MLLLGPVPALLSCSVPLVLCTVYPVFCVQGTMCAVYSVPCVLCTVYPVCCVQYTLCVVYSVPCVLCTVYPVCCVQSTLCVVYSVPCVLCTVYPVYWIQCTLNLLYSTAVCAVNVLKLALLRTRIMSQLNCKLRSMINRVVPRALLTLNRKASANRYVTPWSCSCFTFM